MRSILVPVVVGAMTTGWFAFLYTWLERDHFDPGVLILCLLLTMLTFRVLTRRSQ